MKSSTMRKTQNLIAAAIVLAAAMIAQPVFGAEFGDLSVHGFGGWAVGSSDEYSLPDRSG